MASEGITHAHVHTRTLSNVYVCVFFTKYLMGDMMCLYLICVCVCVCVSIEEDFVTWKENLWSMVCQKFGIDSSQDSGITREYQLTVHEDLPPEKVFVGEPHRLGTYSDQKA